MELIMGDINGKRMGDIAKKATKKNGRVLAAVAYATANSDRLLFNLCKKNNVDLTYYGRSDSAASSVHSKILEKFLGKKFGNGSKCYLVREHHAKVIWWKDVGVYIGSANFTEPAWGRNIEAGCFFEESEITKNMRAQLENLFETLEIKGVPLNEDHIEDMKKREQRSQKFLQDGKAKAKNSIKEPRMTAKKLQQKKDFVDEWNSTQKILNNIAKHFEGGKNRPKWVKPSIPPLVHADQFLHAYHDGLKKIHGNDSHEIMYKRNRNLKDKFLKKCLDDWRNSDKPPHVEADIMNLDFPLVNDELQRNKIFEINQNKFVKICGSVHAIHNYARGRKGRKIEIHAREIYNSETAYKQNIRDVLFYLLYGGEIEDLPSRLWDCIYDRRYKIKHLGIGALGEISGWVHCHKFSPRNGRTSRALRTFGHDVHIHN